MHLIARMNVLEIMVFAAPLFAGIVVICAGLFAVWLNERDERRKVQRQPGE
jgi:hypothetical protein